MFGSKTLSTSTPKESKEVFDFKEITEFNPALIYGFDAEKSFHDYDTNDFRYLLHGTSQIQDMFDAYEYAGTVLQIIRKTGIEKITADQLIEFIKQIHLRIAKTLANDLPNDLKVSAGEYTKTQVYRWRLGQDFSNFVLEYFASPLKFDLDEVAKKFGCSKETVQQFLLLLKKKLKDQSISISQPILKKSEDKKGVTAIYKLEAQFHANKLTKKELGIMSKVITICSPPEQLPDMMEKYVKDLLNAWRICDPKNLDQVAEFLYRLFYQLTEIHPFFNANGRTATCLLNIALRYFNMPSILIRYPDENIDSESNYSMAIKKINTEPKLFIEHLKSRIKNKPYENTTLKEMIMLRMEFGKIITELKKQIGEKKLDGLFREFMSKPLPTPDFEIDDNHDRYMLFVMQSHYICYFAEILQKKELENKAAKLTLAISPVVQRQYNQEEIKSIVTKLQDLTKKDAKAFKDKGSLVVLLTMKNDEKEKVQATKTVTALNKTQALNAQLFKDLKTGGLTIKISSINLAKLSHIEVLEGISFAKPEEHSTSALRNPVA